MKLGIDIGSYYLKSVLLDSSGNLADHLFFAHNGQPAKMVHRLLDRFGEPVSAIGITGTLADLIAPSEGHIIDDVQSMIQGSFFLNGYANNILYLGASSISLIKMNAQGDLIDLRTNSICAAGTGSFLDQQSERMGINLAEAAKFQGMDKPPSIAARCSVFAKSDLIHRQQEGYTVPQLWCGLCRGLSFTIANTLLSGEVLQGKTVIIGGLALNSEAMKWLNTLINGDLHVIENPHLVAAVGAARLARENGDLKQIATYASLAAEKQDASHPRRPSLELKRSSHSKVKVHYEKIDEEGNEIRLLEPLTGTYRVSMGMDIGSTSTKIAILDEQNRVLIDIYRRTAGDPVGAMKKILCATHALLKESGAEFIFTACGTTGSGRNLIGQILGADRIVNEITAHACGAKLLFGEEIETIIEIGGQDSKYVHMKQGRVDNVNMNYVCAAGTGSFVEEQANKLGMKVHEVGDIMLGLTPPFTSERCTVFMERDVEKLLREGFSREEAMAAVLYSVCFNYLTKVVGTRPITGEKILFQGATARNKGLVSAFEIILNKEIVTSHFCHVTGAIGAAALAKEQVEAVNARSSFRGIDFYNRQIEVYYDTCQLCVNHCKITHAQIEGEAHVPSWGYMCGREPEDLKRVANTNYMPFEQRRAFYKKAGRGSKPKTNSSPDLQVVLPNALTTYAHLPLWRTFFNHLGVSMSLTPATNRAIVEQGISSSTADFCFPVKAFLGHVAQGLNTDKHLFIPHVIAGEKPRLTSKSVFCPYVQSAPSIALSSEILSEKLKGRLFNPVIDFSMPNWINIKELTQHLKPFGLGRNQIARAWEMGLAALQEHQQKCLLAGHQLLAEVEATGEKAVVLVGRYYNLYDEGINLGIPRKLSELGFKVIPYEFLPFDEKSLGPFFQNMFWYYGQRILSAAKYVKKKPNLSLVFLTNFSCGPDSFILTYVEQIMGQKPSLVLELDEHGADTGYGTRLEAFADVIRTHDDGPQEKSLLYISQSNGHLRSKHIFIPPMHSAVVPMFAAAFAKHGYRSSFLDITPEQFELGRKHTRGSECLPAHLTAGNLLYALDKYNLKPDEAALFMPTSDGPCRFGQYATLHRIILNKFGYNDVTLLSPSAQNAYMGLESDLRRDLWKAVLIGDIIFKLYCRLAPYEKNQGETKKILQTVLDQAYQAFKAGEEYPRIIQKAQSAFLGIEVKAFHHQKPLVGIVGEIFVRCNPFSCDHVVDWIIASGGEPWLSPISEWILYTSYFHRYESRKTRDLKEMIDAYFKSTYFTRMEHQAYHAAGMLLHNRHEPPMDALIEKGKKYFPVEFSTEAILTVGRAALFIEKDGADMIVNASPFTCMPGVITGGIFRQMSSQTGIPIINMYYDGTIGLNEKIGTFLRNLKGRGRLGDGAGISNVTFQRASKSQ